MKLKNILFILPILLLFSACDVLEDDLSDAEIVSGLKEALQIGTDTSSAQLNATDGYFGNPQVKIPFPENVQYVADAVSNFHLLDQPVGQIAVDALVLKLNRAAENAADEAKPIFIQAITALTIEDGLGILMGADDAATNYLKTSTFDQLKTAFKPGIQNSLNQVGAQNAWNDISSYYNIIAADTVNTDLAEHTTRKALDGLFSIISLEELKIRTDVNARVSDLLQKVFAEQD